MLATDHKVYELQYELSVVVRRKKGWRCWRITESFTHGRRIASMMARIKRYRKNTGSNKHNNGASAMRPTSRKVATDTKNDPKIQTTMATIKSVKHVQIKSDVLFENHSRKGMRGELSLKIGVQPTPRIFPNRFLVFL
ncbi:hypothetical protein EKK58_00965 [Candidatus Dependentiae bacterium]|nr:MAG: hypothetical protein EKK58_00965 [Candidatus Dependentiae bacterium]